MLKTRSKIGIKSRMMSEKATVTIGKRGLTPSIIDEIVKQLKQHEIVKIKSLSLQLQDEEQMALLQDVSKKTKSQVVEVRGNTLVLYSSKKMQREQKAAE